MRLLDEIDVDITDWEFRDVTPGRTPFTLDSASTGELVNTVKVVLEIDPSKTDYDQTPVEVVKTI